MPRYYLLVFVFAVISHKAKAQGSTKVLEARQGFRDAKMGMQFSAFKGMKIVKRNEFTALPNEDFYPVDYMKVCERLSDSKKLGNVLLKHIYYEFYRERLYAIVIVADVKYEGDIVETFMDAYGPAVYTGPYPGNDTKIWVWGANTIDVGVTNSTHSGDIGKVTVVTYGSITISEEMLKEQARRKREAKFNRVNGL